MGKTRYEKAQDCLLHLKAEKGNLIPFKDLRIEVMKNIGSDIERTTKPYISMMFELNMIKKEGETNVTILI